MILYTVLSKPQEKPNFSPFWSKLITPHLLENLSRTSGWILKKNTKGKPFAYNKDSGDTGFVSISHSRRFLAIGVSLSVSVGVDIEFQRQRNFQELAAYAFGKNEQSMVKKEGSNAFYRIWTAREALTKATDIGLFDSMDGRDIFRGEPRTIQNKEQKFTILSKSFISNYILTLVFKKNNKVIITPREAPIHIPQRAIKSALIAHKMNISEPILSVKIGPLY